MAHQRPGDELRKEHDEHAEVEKAVNVPVAAAKVDQVGDLLEHEETDTSGSIRPHGRQGSPTSPNTVPRKKSAYLNRPAWRG